MPTGFAILGTGMIANFHARGIADCPGAKLIACHSRNPTKSQAFAEQHQCRYVEKLEDLLENPEVQVVTICTPSGAHLEPAVAAAKAGKHVIVEKPLEVTLKRCDQIIDACRTAGVTLGVTFQSRFHRSAQLMKEAVAKNRFGRLTLGDAYVKWYRTQQYYDSGAWRGTWKLDGGGALMNQAIHSVDLLLWLMGPVVEVTSASAMLAHERIEVEDVVVATLKFANGALGVIEATTAAYPGRLKRVEISGSEGTAILEEENIICWQFAKMTAKDEKLREEMLQRTQTGGGAADPAAIGHHGHAAVFRDFLKSLRTKKPPLIEGSQGRQSVELILAIYRAAKSGKKVTLPLK
jgi:predicted dehydrogenase